VVKLRIQLEGIINKDGISGQNKSGTIHIREYRKSDKDKRGVHSMKNGVGLVRGHLP
jgi:hypothetical protein